MTALTIISLLLVPLLLSSCAGTARLYNLKTAQVVELQFEDNGTGHGKVNGMLPNGERLSGEYNTLQGGGEAVTTSTARGAGYAWATAQGFSFSRPNTNYGAATMVGGGLVIDCVYGTSGFPSHGEGVCHDNMGEKYRLHF